MRVTVHHEGFYDVHPLEADEALPAGATPRRLADGSLGVQFVRREPNHTQFDYHGGADLKAEFAAYKAACDSIERPLEYETEQEWLAMHVREVMKHHAPRAAFTGIGVDRTSEDETDEDLLAHAEHLRAQHGNIPAPDPDHPTASNLTAAERRAAALSSLGIADFPKKEQS